MMNLRFGFQWIGLIVFILPMLINIVYAVVPPVDSTEPKKTNRFVEGIEQVTRGLYLIVLVIFVSNENTKFMSIWLMAAVLFLILYYIVWIRYFRNGRHIRDMQKSFLGIPIPLAVFPVLYFLCAAIWLNNYVAAIVMVIFGITHNIVSHMAWDE